MDIEQSFKELETIYQSYLSCFEDEDFIEEEVASAYHAGVIGALTMLHDNPHNDMELLVFVIAIQEMMVRELELEDEPGVTH